MKLEKQKTRPQQDPNVYPPGWDHQRVQEVIDYYDKRQDVDLFEEVELPDPDSLPVWVEVPQALLPQVRKLIALHKNIA